MSEPQMVSASVPFMGGDSVFVHGEEGLETIIINFINAEGATFGGFSGTSRTFRELAVVMLQAADAHDGIAPTREPNLAPVLEFVGPCPTCGMPEVDTDEGISICVNEECPNDK